MKDGVWEEMDEAFTAAKKPSVVWTSNYVNGLKIR